MKIVHVCLSGVYTEGWSYQENFLSKYHKRLGNEVTLIANKLMYDDTGKKVETQESSYINDYGVKVLRLQEKAGKPLSKFQRYPGLYAVLEKEQPDILFVHSCQFLDTDQIIKYKKAHSQVIVYVDNTRIFLIARRDGCQGTYCIRLYGEDAQRSYYQSLKLSMV